MTADRWARIDPILQSALARPDGEREAFVRAACADDAGLRDEVMSLLAHAASADGFLETAPQPSPAPLEPGQRLGPYTVGELLGVGGMGEVYRARDSKLGRDVAIKILSAKLAGDADRLRRFEQEARAAAALNHPNIVTIYSVEQAGDLHFLTMELVEGRPLTALIPRHGLPLDRLLNLAVPLADAVGAAHARGIIHRDLKPSNVMVTPEGRVKILDFGLAKLKPLTSLTELTTQGAPEATAVGQILGTAAYMSPEQAEGHEVDHRSDLFSLGVMLFELATGERPFKGETTVSLLSSLLKDTPPAVSDLRPELPRELAQLVRACLRKDPERRYQSAKDIRNDLQTLKEELASGELARWGPVEPSRLRGLRAFAWIASGVGVLTTTGLVYLAWRSTFDTRPPSAQPAAQSVTQRMQFAIAMPEGVTAINGLSVSPDGSRIAFVGAGRLWIHDLGTRATAPLLDIVGPEPQFPFWSPNGQFIAYFQRGKLKKIPAAGGISQDICDVAAGRGGSWSEQDTIIFAQGGSTVFRVPAAGGVPTPVTRLDPRKDEIGHVWPHFLPDGRHFTYLAWGSESSVYLGSLDPSEPRRVLTPVGSEAYVSSGFVLTTLDTTLRAQPLASNGTETTGEPVPLARPVSEADAIAGHYSFAASGPVLAYAATAPRRFQFSVIDRSGTRSATVGPPILISAELQAGVYNWSLSPDRRKLAFAQMDPETREQRIWLLDLARGMTTSLTAAHGSGGDEHPVWAPSSDQIAFTRWSVTTKGVPARQDLYLKRVGSDVETQVGESSPELKAVFDWHPDGHTLLFGMQRPPKGQYNFWLLDPAEGEKPDPWFRSDFRYAAGQFSPHGQWVAYQSDISGSNEIYIRRFPSGEGEERISTAGGWFPHWRPDGKTLFYVQPETPAAEWPGTLMEVDLAIGGTARPGKPLFGLEESLGYAVLQDGQRFVVCRPIDSLAPPTITVVLNWAAGLKPK